MLVLSANLPNTAEPNPPIPKAKPKNKPDTVPTLPGSKSCAYTKMAEKAEARISPMNTLKMVVQKRFTWGSNNVKGATPKIENQMTYFLPKRSPSGPPRNVPTAVENRKIKRCTCEFCTDTPNLSMR